MVYLAHTAHWQFFGLVVGCVGWILTMVTAGLNEWRLWYVADESVITSGVAWVGIWRACFYSHVLSGPAEVCRSMGIAQGYVPVEISVAQVLCVAAVVLGLAGSVSAFLAVRSVYFSMDSRRHVPLLFSAAGGFYVLTGLCSLVPLAWNMSSVLANRTIHFPPEFYMPAAPVTQGVGSAIGTGMIASFLVIIGGVSFLCYRLPGKSLRSWVDPTKDPLNGPWTTTVLSKKSPVGNGDAGVGGSQARDNPGFLANEKP
ncbi:claudin-34 [Aplochiton taeniatus]